MMIISIKSGSVDLRDLLQGSKRKFSGRSWPWRRVGGCGLVCPAGGVGGAAKFLVPAGSVGGVVGLLVPEESTPVVCSVIRVGRASEGAEAAVALCAGVAHLPAAVELSLARPPPLPEVLRAELAVVPPATTAAPVFAAPELLEGAVVSEGVVLVGVCQSRRTGRSPHNGRRGSGVVAGVARARPDNNWDWETGGTCLAPSFHSEMRKIIRNQQGRILMTKQRWALQSNYEQSQSPSVDRFITDFTT